jgi:hypothetical protein
MPGEGEGEWFGQVVNLAGPKEVDRPVQCPVVGLESPSNQTYFQA